MEQHPCTREKEDKRGKEGERKRQDAEQRGERKEKWKRSYKQLSPREKENEDTDIFPK